MSQPKLYLFGSCRLCTADGQAVILPLKAFQLFLFLLAQGAQADVPRARIASFLWPDLPGAANNLRQLLARLRAALNKAGIALLTVEHSSLRLETGSVELDYQTFTHLVGAIDWANCHTLLDLYGDGLLASIEPDATDLANWLEAQRVGVRGLLVGAVAGLLGRDDIRSNLNTAQTIASRLLGIDAYQEEGYRALMRCAAARGQFALVTATFERCRSVLNSDLGIVPSQQTVALFRRITAGRQSGDPASAAPADSRVEMTMVSLPRLLVLHPAPEGQDDDPTIANLVLDDVTIALCGLKTVLLIAPHTSWKLGNAPDDTTLRQFDISYVAETTQRRYRGTVNLAIRLFDSLTRAILWTQTYQLTTETSEYCHRDLSVGIAIAVADAIERAEIDRMASERDPRAYYHYLIGQKHLRHMDLPNVRRARQAFKSAIAADPEYAAGYSGIARALQREWLILGRGDEELLLRAEEAGRKAVGFDFRDARGHREVALGHLYRRHWDEAVASFSEAERLAPQHADLIADFSDTLGHCGEPAAGLVKLSRALELNPIPPDQYRWHEAGLHFQLRHYHEALAAIKKMEHPLPALRIAAASWAYLGERSEAHRCAAAFLESYPDFRIDDWLAIVPDKRPEDRQHYAAGLRQAGFQ